MANVSLVALYGKKPPTLVKLIKALQTVLYSQPLIQTSFIPYQIEQIHGTIIGCEGTEQDGHISSKWFQELRAENKFIDFPNLIEFCQTQIQLPTVRWAGYQPHIDYQFLSRNQRPYHRSFQLQSTSSETIPILIGWSWRKNCISQEVDQLRSHFQQFNLLHKYHRTIDAVDNDFYLRLGTITRPLTPKEIIVISKQMRQLLVTELPIYIPIRVSDLSFVQYQDEALELASTKTVKMTDITSTQLRQMYFRSPFN